MHLYRFRPIPQQMDALLEALSLPILHVHIHTIPPNEAHERLLFLSLLLQLLHHPPMRLRNQPFRIHNRLLHEVLEILVVSLLFRLGEPGMEVYR